MQCVSEYVACMCIGTATGKDRPVVDVIDLLRTANLVFPFGICDNEGLYIVRSIDSHHVMHLMHVFLDKKVVGNKEVSH